MYEKREYFPEQVFMQYVQSLRFSVGFWQFCNVGRHRLGADASGHMTVARFEVSGC